jgi:uncharacterized protein
MRINLNEIPAEGRTYEFSRKTGELNDALSDLLEKNPYEVELFIKPMGNAFEMNGKIASHKAAVCSKCGSDMDLPLVQNIKEILIEEPKEYRKDHGVHGNGAVDFLGNGPGVTLYRDPFFNIDDYVHEAFALAEPFYPECGENDCQNIQEVEAKLREIEESSAIERTAGHPAFSVLEKLKGKTQQ